MHVAIIVDPARLWRWQLMLADALAEGGGHRVVCVEAAAGPVLPTAVAALLAIERRLASRSDSAAPQRPSDRIDPGELAAYAGTGCPSSSTTRAS